MILRKTKQTAKFLTIGAMIGSYVAHAAWLRKGKRSTWENRKKTAEWLKSYSQFGLRVLGVEISMDGEPLSGEAELFVGNHLSYLDILIFSAFQPTSFVTSQEIRETPVLGYLCDVAGCLFVERRNRENLKKEVAQISEGLENGCNVVVYPEATSTNGDFVLRFKRPLFGAAVFAGSQVRPFTLNYTHLNGSPLTKESRDTLFWYGDMDFVPHLWALCDQKSVVARLTFHKAINTEEVDDASRLAVKSHQLVSEHFLAFDPKQGESVQKEMREHYGFPAES